MNLAELVQGITHVLLETTIASSVALVLVLLLRRRLRMMFGASVAYAAWLLVPVASIAVLLPAAASDTGMIPVVHGIVALPMQVVVAGAEPGIRYAQWLCAAWLLGAVIAAFHFMRQQRRFRATLGRLQMHETGLHQADGVAGLPAAIGWIKPLIVLPVDFDTRYSVEQRSLMLAHEQSHVRHGDLQANAAYLALRCLFWFNPLIHFAAHAFRHDQELACDQRVIARHPQSRRAYGEAMFRTQLAAQPLPLGCHWGLTHPLKERIEMLKQPLAPPAVRIGGLALVFTLSFGMGFAAWSAQPAGTNVSQAKGRVDFRAQLKINVDDKLASRFSISERFGQPFTVKDNHGGSSIELTGTVRPVTQHGGLFFQIQATVKKDGVPYGTPMMIVGEGNTGSLMVGKKMLDGRFNGVEIAMKITPVDAASALAQAVPYQSPLRVPAPPPSPKAPAVPPVPPAPHLPLPPPVPPVPPAPAGSSSNSAAIAVQTPAPKYPVLTAGQRTDGKVILVVELAADGSVSNAIVEKSEPTDKFGAAALQAVKDWKFKPALKDGKPVPSRVRVPIWFEPVKVPESTPQS